MEVFLARQPIFDAEKNVYAYELLFRSSLENVFRCPDPDHASSRVIADSSLLLGLDTVTGGRRAFVNVTREVLVHDHAAVLPPQSTVIELLETIEPDPDVIAACRRLKQAGYTLALDDFVYHPRYEPLVELADIVKVDFLATDAEQRQAMADDFLARGIRLVAEKVETQEEFDEGAALGYTYFQGYFFSKPVILRGRDVPGFKLNYLQVLRELNRPEVDLDEVDSIIRRELSLSYKLLRYVNSSFFSWRSEIRTIRQALVLLGPSEIRKWASLMAMASMGEDKPDELVVHAVVRARFCEALSTLARRGTRSEDAFLLGMFSSIDAIVDQPLSVVLDMMPLAHDLKAALLGGSGFFASLLECALSYEAGSWDTLSSAAAEISVDERQLPGLYVDAIDWANATFQGAAAAS